MDSEGSSPSSSSSSSSSSCSRSSSLIGRCNTICSIPVTPSSPSSPSSTVGASLSPPVSSPPECIPSQPVASITCNRLHNHSSSPSPSLLYSSPSSSSCSTSWSNSTMNHRRGGISSLTNTVFGGKYLIKDPLEASALYNCTDTITGTDYVSKVVPTKGYHDYLSGYMRMNGNCGINSIETVFVGPKQSFILFPSSYGDLHSYVRSKSRLPEVEAINLFHQIAHIVNDCHHNGICLRDLKLRKFVFRDPEQTLLKLETLDDAVVLQDVDNDLLGERHGCPAYVSPEILTTTRSRYSGRAADCWSLGVILFTMMVGRYPFHDTNPTHLFGKIRRGLFTIPTFISPLSRCIIHSLLQKDPQDRMTSDDLLETHLFSIDSYFSSKPSLMSTKSCCSCSGSSLSVCGSNRGTSSGPKIPTIIFSTKNHEEEVMEGKRKRDERMQFKPKKMMTMITGSLH